MEILVGVGVIVIRNGRVLLGKRRGSHGAATWGLPGGHLDAGESIEQCASRETQEETGLCIQRFVRAGFTSDIFETERKQYITLFVEGDDPGGEPETLEPHACECWQWFAWNHLPEPLFTPFQSLVEQGYRPMGNIDCE